MPLHRMTPGLFGAVLLAVPGVHATQIWPGLAPPGQHVSSNPPAAVVRHHSSAPARVHSHSLPMWHGNSRHCDHYEGSADAVMQSQAAAPTTGQRVFPTTREVPARGWSSSRVTSTGDWRDAPAHGGWRDGASASSNCGRITTPVNPGAHGGPTSLGDIHWTACPRHYYRSTVGGICLPRYCGPYRDFSPSSSTGCSAVRRCPSGASLRTGSACTVHGRPWSGCCIRTVQL